MPGLYLTILVILHKVVIAMTSQLPRGSRRSICMKSGSARRPRREQVIFFPRPVAAEQADYITRILGKSLLTWQVKPGSSGDCNVSFSYSVL